MAAVSLDDTPVVAIEEEQKEQTVASVSIEDESALSAEQRDVRDAAALVKRFPDKEIDLISKEGDRFRISLRDASVSKLVVAAFQTDSSSTELELSGVDTQTLRHFVEFMKQHRGTDARIPDKPIRSTKMVDIMEKFDAEFADKLFVDTGRVGEDGHKIMDPQQLFSVLMATPYLGVPGLMHVLAAKIASLIKGQPISKIEQELGTLPNKKRPREVGAEGEE
jgi:hypothetical protein